MGDGEINEGSVWEAAMCAGKHKLSNLTAIVDYNKIQSAGRPARSRIWSRCSTSGAPSASPPVEVDGHDVAALRKRVRAACRSTPDKPTAIICHTVKGKGIPFAENDANWHHKSKIAAGRWSPT